MKLKYTKAMMEVVELAAEDVVLTSGCADDECWTDGIPACPTQF